MTASRLGQPIQFLDHAQAMCKRFDSLFQSSICRQTGGPAAVGNRMPDYIVVGGGSAGCVIASRLSEDPDTTVLLLEAGPRDTAAYIHMPVGFSKMTGSPLLWDYTTTPGRELGGRQFTYPQGRVLGGGSSVNAQVFTRGCPEDYDAWAEEEGCDGWSFRDVQPYFVRAEGNDVLGGAYHGTDGPLAVSTPKPHELSRAFVQAAQQAGLPYNADFNGPHQAGCGFYQTTTRNGRRCSASVGYLRPTSGRPNLKVCTGVTAYRIAIKHGRAVGVEVIEDGRSRVIPAEREVIISAGAIGSPKLLLLSGIGSANNLAPHGIAVTAELSGVGRNLQDHMDVDTVFELTGPHSYDKYKKLGWKLWAGMEYKLFGGGPVASNIVEAGAFWWGDRSEPTPDLQFHFLPGAGVEKGVGDVPSGNGCTLNTYHTRPRSRGSVSLRSADPRAAPVIDVNAFAEPYDLERTIDGLILCRDIMSQPAFARYVAQEHVPGHGVRSRADYAAFARECGRSAYHPVGTCRMGHGADAVVDTSLRVHGIERLRVCDSSIMPRLISSNTNAACIMIGEKAADLIRGNRPAPPRTVTLNGAKRDAALVSEGD